MLKQDHFLKKRGGGGGKAPPPQQTPNSARGPCSSRNFGNGKIKETNNNVNKCIGQQKVIEVQRSTSREIDKN